MLTRVIPRSRNSCSRACGNARSNHRGKTGRRTVSGVAEISAKYEVATTCLSGASVLSIYTAGVVTLRGKLVAVGAAVETDDKKVQVRTMMRPSLQVVPHHTSSNVPGSISIEISAPAAIP